jgi:PAS domain S-box-containing protein
MANQDERKQHLLEGLAEMQRPDTAQESAERGRERAEGELTESSALLQATIDNLPFDVFALGMDGRYTLQNATSKSRWGNVVGKRLEDVAKNEDTLTLWRENNRRAMAGEKIEEDVTLLVNGEKYYCHNVIVPIIDAGHIQGILGMNVDITQRKRAEQQLTLARDELQRRVAETRFNEARLEAVLQLGHMADASLKQITDFALEQAVALTKSKIGYLSFMNEDETVLTMHSWSKEAMTECAMSDKPLLYPLATTGLWGEAARQRKPIVTNDYAAPSPWKKGLPEGHVALTRHMNVPILDAGRVVVVAGVGNKEEDYNESDVRQLTLLMESMWALLQRQRAQSELQQHRDHLEQLVTERTEALRQSEEKHRGLLEACPDAIIMVNLTGTILFASRQTWPLVGLADQDELVGRSVFDYVIEADRQRLAENIPLLMQTGFRHRTEYTVLCKDGTTVPTEISSAVNRDAAGRPIAAMAVIRDVTDRKRAEEILQKEHSTLKHLLQSSDHERQLIAYEIHDELAQQLAGAMMQLESYAHLKDEKPRLAAKAFEAGMAMLQQGHFEARRLISGVRPPILDEEGVVAAVAHLVNEQSRLKGPRIEYRSRVDFNRLAPILENGIYRIAQEGLANACQHSKSAKVRVGIVQRDDRVQIEIRDWGVGFDLKTVLEGRFGLVGIRQRARLLGGKCSIRSTPGKGTRIVVKLPVVARE